MWSACLCAWRVCYVVGGCNVVMLLSIAGIVSWYAETVSSAVSVWYVGS